MAEHADLDSEAAARGSKCSQCERTAVVDLGGIPLCVEHHLMMEQAAYLGYSMLVSHGNDISADIEAATGVPQERTYLAPPPFIGSTGDTHNIVVTDSNIGLINTGTLKHVRNIDASVTVTRAGGDEALAGAIQEFTQALVDETELDMELKQQIAESIEFLAGQSQAKPAQRSRALAKSILIGTRDLIVGSAALLRIWSTLEPLLAAALELAI